MAHKFAFDFTGPLPSYFNIYSRDERFDWISPLFDHEPHYRVASEPASQRKKSAAIFQKAREMEVANEMRQIDSVKPGDLVHVYPTSKTHIHMYGASGIVILGLGDELYSVSVFIDEIRTIALIVHRNEIGE